MRLRTAFPTLPVLVISAEEQPDIVREAMSAGVAGYVPKSSTGSELAHAISEALAGSIYVPKQFLPLTDNRDAVGVREPMAKRLRDLTPQQLTVLDLVRRGLQNKQIAYELKLAETTVKTHVSEILRKLRVSTRTQAVGETAKVDFAAVREMR